MLPQSAKLTAPSRKGLGYGGFFGKGSEKLIFTKNGFSEKLTLNGDKSCTYI